MSGDPENLGSDIDRELEAVPIVELLRELHAQETAANREGDIAIYWKPEKPPRRFSWKAILHFLRRKRQEYAPIDSRKDLVEVTDLHIQDLAKATALLVRDTDLARDGDHWVLQTEVFGEAFDLCPGERFWHQPCAGFGSGVLVAPDLVATAGHCISYVDWAVGRIRFLFDFRVGADGEVPVSFPGEAVYTGKELVGYEESPDLVDWALVKLDRPVAGVPIPALRRAGTLGQTTEVEMVGHPCGLPKKHASQARATKADHPGWFKATLDAFHGNSGSPVFSRAADGSCLVEGLLVRGEEDWIPREGADCQEPFFVPLTSEGYIDTDGETCTKVAAFLDRIPTRDDNSPDR
jgi:hypothetical protein